MTSFPANFSLPEIQSILRKFLTNQGATPQSSELTLLHHTTPIHPSTSPPWTPELFWPNDREGKAGPWIMTLEKQWTVHALTCLKFGPLHGHRVIPPAGHSTNWPLLFNTQNGTYLFRDSKNASPSEHPGKCPITGFQLDQ